MDALSCLPAYLFFYKSVPGILWPKGILRDLFTGTNGILHNRCRRMVICPPESDNQGFLYTLLLLFYEFVDVAWFLPVCLRQSACKVGQILQEKSSIIRHDFLIVL